MGTFLIFVTSYAIGFVSGAVVAIIAMARMLPKDGVKEE